MRTKAGISNPRIIDLVTQSDRTGEYVLVMIQNREWDGSNKRLVQLQRKFNSYLSFLLDGQMTRLYPDSKGKPIRIRVDCTSPPDPITEEVLRQFEEQLRQYGISLEVYVFD